MAKTVFTTGEAAKICKVSQQTIIRCFDSGQLKGFRVPGSRFRRIPRDVLYKFMKENGIPTDALESGKRKVLLVDDEPAGQELFKNFPVADPLLCERDGLSQTKRHTVYDDRALTRVGLCPHVAPELPSMRGS
jgi:excisionase family DNA binding protein